MPGLYWRRAVFDARALLYVLSTYRYERLFRSPAFIRNLVRASQVSESQVRMSGWVPLPRLQGPRCRPCGHRNKLSEGGSGEQDNSASMICRCHTIFCVSTQDLLFPSVRFSMLRHSWFGSSITPLGYKEHVPLHESSGKLFPVHFISRYPMPPRLVARTRTRLPRRSLRVSTNTKPKSHQCTISSLPNEIFTAILELLPDLHSLGSALHVCRRWYNIYAGSHGRIARLIFTKICKRVQYYQLGEIFWNLVFAINEPYMHRLYVKHMFAEAWPIFTSRQLEELLYPIGMALARTCDRVVETALLRMAWDGDALLPSPSPPQHITGNPTRWQPALLMVGERLLELTIEEAERGSISAGLKHLVSVGHSLRRRVVRVLVKKKGIVLQTEDSSLSKWPCFSLVNAPRLPFETVNRFQTTEVSTLVSRDWKSLCHLLRPEAQKTSDSME